MTEINLMEIPDCPFIDKGLAFESDMWAEGRFEMVELKKPFRQSEQSFIAALNDIREGRGDTAATRALVRQCAGSPSSRGSTGGMTRTRSSTRSRRSHSNSGSGGGGGGGSSSSSGGGGGVGGDENGIKPTLLFPKNKSVDAENERELDKLGGKTVEFPAQDRAWKDKEAGEHASGYHEETLLAKIDRECLAPKTLCLKVGAQVMLLRRLGDIGLELVNGSRGVVTGFGASEDGGWPVVRFMKTDRRGPLEMPVEPDVFEMEVFGKGTAERKQVPVKLAWAVTIHKSQGLSLDSVVVDLEGCFAEGQVRRGGGRRHKRLD
jgi:hypothetical protein